MYDKTVTQSDPMDETKPLAEQKSQAVSDTQESKQKIW